jgi:uncharacterized protein (TIGR02452 family)
MKITPETAAAMGAEAVAIMETGCYESPGRRLVEIQTLLERAKAGTVSYPPGSDSPPPAPGRRITRIGVANQTTLAAAHAFVVRGLRPAALNFASATTPGGGFVGGAVAQEESLCWSSALFACLRGNDMYAFHQNRDDWLHSDYVLYTPEVPVFRGDDGVLLEQPWPCAFLTSPAPVTTHFLGQHPDGQPTLVAAFRSRIAKVLSVAAHHGHEELVLGAWGCGAFGGDAETVAPLFREALEGPFRGVFSKVVFAIRDSEPLQLTMKAFAAEFGAAR